MARERMVTRTVTENTIEALLFNLTDNKTEVMQFTVGGDVSDDATAKALCEKRLKGDNNRVFLKVMSVYTVERLYGMTEEEFIKLARILPPR